MNSPNLYKRMRWNFLIAVCFVITIAMITVGVVNAAATAGTNDDIPDTFPQSPLDSGEWGDLPLDYSIMGPPGIMHAVDDGLLLGTYKDYEEVPQPDALAGSGSTGGDDNNPSGDPDDEDGVFRNMNELWTIGATVHLTVTVDGCDSEPCYLNGWIDWEGGAPNWSFVGDQIFSDRTVFEDDNYLELMVPENYTVGQSVFAHFRLCDSPGLTAAGGCNELGGRTLTGEVEDYYWEFEPTAVELVSIEANTNYAVPFALLAGALILLVCGGTILTFKRHRV